MMASGLLVVEQCQELDSLIEQLTTSGDPELNEVKLKKLKNICKQSNEYVKKCYHSLMIQLDKEHAEIRLSCVQIADALFSRSHVFRELLLADFKDFMELTIETNADCPLPPPKHAAKILKSKTIECVHKWYERFGDAYKKLALGYNYLKNCRKVNFQDIHARSIAEQQREENRRARIEAQQQEKLNKTIEEMTEMSSEIEMSLVQAENCLLLLLPDPEHFSINGSTSPTGADVMDSWSNKVSQGNDSSCEVTTSNRDTGYFRKTCSRLPQDNCDSSDENKPMHNVIQSPGDNNEIATEYESHGLLKGAQKEVNQTESEQYATPSEDSSLSHSECPHRNQDLNEFCEPSSEDSEEEMSSEEINDASEDGEEGMSTGVNMMRDHGICSQEFSININIMQDHVTIEENQDNEEILKNLKDMLHLIEARFLPAIQKWLEIFAKTGAEQKYIRRALDLRASLDRMKEKIGKLRIVKSSSPRTTQSKGDVNAQLDSDSDDDFEEVKDYKEGYEPHIPDHLREEYGLIEKPAKPRTNPDWEMPKPSERDEKDPTAAETTIKKLKQQMKSHCSSTFVATPSTSGISWAKNAKLKDVPSIPFGMDLFHWGEKIETPLMVRYDSEHRFWIPNTAEDKVDVNALESMKSRVINFVGTFEPVRRSCKAPLPNGKLCPRMDRHKCPFHGEIIPRDDNGQPINPEHKVKDENKEEIKKEIPEWEDPELQAEIMAATGIDLSRKGKGRRGKGRSKGKGRQKKYPGLTDIRKELNPVRKRLEKKVLNRNAIRRVSDALSAVDEKKRKDKFGNTFHYVHDLRKS